PGTPYFSDASEDFQNALAIFDVAENGSDARSNALQTTLAKSRKRDALTLWHLLARTDGDDRLRVYNRLAELIPPPPQATPDAVMRGDHAALDLWWEKLELGSAEWWRIWKGPVPSQTKQLPANNGGTTMSRRTLRSVSSILITTGLLLALVGSAPAGPVLICKNYEIGAAKSLPWGGSDWRSVKPDYDINRLVEDTLALLTPET